MDQEIVDWLIELDGKQSALEKCIVLFGIGTEVRVRREQSSEATPRYYLHTSRFIGLPDLHIHKMADDLIADVNAALKSQGETDSVLMKDTPISVRANGSRVPMIVVTYDAVTAGEILASVVADGRAAAEVVSYSQQLMSLARNLLDENRYSIAIVVAHMACEIATEQALSEAFRIRGIEYLKDWVIGAINGYNLANERIRSLYTALTGDQVQNANFWQQFRASAHLRNKIIHRGGIAEKADAEHSYKACVDLWSHLKK